MELEVRVEKKALTEKAAKAYDEWWDVTMGELEGKEKGYLLAADTSEINLTNDGKIRIGLTSNELDAELTLDVRELVEDAIFWGAIKDRANEIRKRREHEDTLLKLAEMGFE